MKGAEIRLKLLSDVSGRVTFIIFYAGLHLRARHFCMFSVSAYQKWYNNNVRKAKLLTFTLTKVLNMIHPYQEGDAVIVQTKHYGPYYGIVGAVDPDGSIVVRHNLKRYPNHPSGATYVCAKYLGKDVTRVNGGK